PTSLCLSVHWLSHVAHSFFHHYPLALLYLHSFPTRRSSDLIGHSLSMAIGDFQKSLEEFLRLRATFDRKKVDDLNEKFGVPLAGDRKSTRLNSSHQIISYAVFCLKKKKTKK